MLAVLKQHGAMYSELPYWGTAQVRLTTKQATPSALYTYDSLCRKPDRRFLVLYGGVVKLAIQRCVLLRLFVRRVFEEEDETDRIELL